MSLTGKSLIGIAAVAALAGCSVANAAETPQPAQSSTPAPASRKPKPTSDEPATKKSWDDVDFEKVMFHQLGCPDFDEAHGKADVFSVLEADVTGDGRTEAVVAGACVTTTGANPAQAVVFGNVADPRRLVAIGKGHNLITANVSVRGRTVTVVSDALSGKAPRCCPDLIITQAYRYQDGHFTRVRYEKKAQ